MADGYDPKTPRAQEKPKRTQTTPVDALSDKVIVLSKRLNRSPRVVLKSAKIDPRTIDSILSGDKPVNRAPITKIIEYCAKELHINIDELVCDLETSTVDEFSECIDNLIKNRRNVISFNLGHPLSEITEAELKYICGVYESYRFSFSGNKDMVREIIVISRPLQSTTGREVKSAFQLSVEMYCHPTVTNPDGSDKEYESFKGILFKFGNMFSIITAFSDDDRDNRMRYLLFPTSDNPKMTIHYGVASGYSSSLSEPASSRIIARRLRSNNELSDSDISRITRGSPEDPIFSSIRKFVEFDQLLEKEQWLMTVNKRSRSQMKFTQLIVMTEEINK